MLPYGNGEGTSYHGGGDVTMAVVMLPTYHGGGEGDVVDEAGGDGGHPQDDDDGHRQLIVLVHLTNQIARLVGNEIHQIQVG